MIQFVFSRRKISFILILYSFQSRSNVIHTMLWEKERNSDLYVDLLENVKYPIQLCRLKRKKCNGDALTARLAGNEKFKGSDFHGAMDKYNQSICFAENGSEYLSIAYGNRSCCFEKLKMFRLCLADIQLAKESNFPQRLMQKLDDRKRKCMDAVPSEQSTSTDQPTLSFPADENFPNMANSLRIDVNDEYRRLITATQHIQIGETILIEEEYVRLVVGENIMCSNCGKKNANFIPCDKCGGAMFCSELCSKNNFHQTECDMLFDANICSDGNFFSVFVLRSVIIALSVFSSTTEIMDFVDNCRTTDQYEIPLTTSTAISKYRAFFKLSALVPDENFSDYRKIAHSVYHSIRSSSLAAKFQTKSHSRFLTHLIMHHICILRTNSFGCFESPTTKLGQSMNADYDYELFLVGSYFNHSCCPNVQKFKKNNLSIFKAILPIREGEQLFISYIDEDDDEYKTEIGRQRFLQNNFGFDCRCAICQEGILKNTLTLQDDIAFVKVVKDLEKLKIKFDLLIVREIIINCKLFLTKFSESYRSAESIYIKHNLVAMIQLELDCQI